MNYDLMWKTILAPDVELRLAGLSDGELKSVCASYVDARTELADALVTSGRASNASEDILDDLAEALLKAGPDAYEAFRSGARPLPPREAWGDLERGNLSRVLGEVLRSRLKTDLQSVFEEAVGE